MLSHLLPQIPAQLGRDPGPTRHIMSGIMVIPSFSILKSGIYRAWGAVDQGEPPCLYLSRPRCPILDHKVPYSLVATPRPRDISCRGVFPFPLFGPSNLECIGCGVLLSRGNRPSFTCLDPAVQFSITRSPTVWSRPRDHAAYHVGDYSRPPFLDPRTWDI